MFVCAQEGNVHSHKLFIVPFLVHGRRAEGREGTPVNTKTHTKTQKSAPPQPKPPHLLKDTCIIVFVSLQTDPPPPCV